MKILRKVGDIRNGFNGLRVVWREEWHFSYQVAAAVLGLPVAWLAGADGIQLVLLASFGCIALAGEVVNTAVEDICNKIQPEFDPHIGAIKDVAQAFVILSGAPYVLLLVWILIRAFL
jgi:diacylglycerol kinase (ATP)